MTDGRGALAVLFVQDGERWWRWQLGRGVVTTNTIGDPAAAGAGSNMVGLIVSHARVLKDTVEIAGSELHGGREVLRIRVPQRELLIDREYGTTLRAVYDGKVLLDLSAIRYDVRIAPERFEPPEIPADVRVEAASRLFHEAPIDEVARLVDFPLYAPTDVVFTWRAASATYWPGDRERPETVIVTAGMSPIWIRQSKEPYARWLGDRWSGAGEWRRISRDGIDFELRERPATLRFVRDGVHIEMNGERSNADELVEIALSLARVPRP